MDSQNIQLTGSPTPAPQPEPQQEKPSVMPVVTVASTPQPPDTAPLVDATLPSPQKTLKLWFAVFAGIIFIGVMAIALFMGKNSLFKGSLTSNEDDFPTLCSKNGTILQDGRCQLETIGKGPSPVNANDLPALQKEIHDTFSRDCKVIPGSSWDEVNTTCTINKQTTDNLKSFNAQVKDLTELLLACTAIGPGAAFKDGSDGSGILCIFNAQNIFTTAELQTEKTLVEALKTSCTEHSGVLTMANPLPSDHLACAFGKDSYDTKEELETAAMLALQQLEDVCTSGFGKATGFVFKDTKYCFAVDKDGNQIVPQFSAATVDELLKTVTTLTAPVQQLCENGLVLQNNGAVWEKNDRGCSVAAESNQLYYKLDELQQASVRLAEKLKITCADISKMMEAVWDDTQKTCSVPALRAAPYEAFALLSKDLTTEQDALQTLCTSRSAEWDNVKKQCLLNGASYATTTTLKEALAQLDAAPARVAISSPGSRQSISSSGSTPPDIETVCKTISVAAWNAPACSMGGIDYTSASALTAVAQFQSVCTTLGGTWTANANPPACSMDGVTATSPLELINGDKQLSEEAKANLIASLLPYPDPGFFNSPSREVKAASSSEPQPSEPQPSEPDAQPIPNQPKVPEGGSPAAPQPEGDPAPQGGQPAPQNIVQNDEVFEAACKSNSGTFANGVCTIQDVGVFRSESELARVLQEYDACAARQDVWDTDANKCISYADYLAMTGGGEEAKKAPQNGPPVVIPENTGDGSKPTEPQKPLPPGVPVVSGAQSGGTTGTASGSKTTTQKTSTAPVAVAGTSSGSSSSSTANASTSGSSTSSATHGTITAVTNSAAAGSTAASTSGSTSAAGSSSASAASGAGSASSASASANGKTAATSGVMHGSYIRGQTGPEGLLYPMLIMAANGALVFVKRRRKEKNKS